MMLGFRELLSAMPALLVVGAVVGTSGCSGKDPYRPGESVGAFHVTSKLVSTTCGATPDPWEFDVKLRYDGNTLYWVQGDAPVSTVVDPTAHAVFTFNDTQTVRAADDKSKTPACTMTRTDSVDVHLAPIGTATAYSAGATSFTGSLGYQFVVADSTSSCEDQLTESGGDYATLPCTVSYTLTAVRTGDAK